MEQQAAVGGGGSGQANLKPIKQEKKTTKRQPAVDFTNKSTKKATAKKALTQKFRFTGKKVTTSVELSGFAAKEMQAQKCCP